MKIVQYIVGKYRAKARILFLRCEKHEHVLYKDSEKRGMMIQQSNGKNLRTRFPEETLSSNQETPFPFIFSTTIKF